jgi:hypothetical protein
MTEKPPASPRGNSASSGKVTVFGVIAVLIFLSMAVELVLLIKQNRELKAEISTLQADLASAREQTLPTFQIGEVVEPLNVVSIHGEPAQITYDDESLDTVLLIFSPNCPSCAVNMENWKELEALLNRELDRIYYVSTMGGEETLPFIEEHQPDGPVFISDDNALLDYRVTYIPTTMEIGPGGVVKNVWVGELPDEAAAEIVGS